VVASEFSHSGINIVSVKLITCRYTCKWRGAVRTPSRPSAPLKKKTVLGVEPPLLHNWKPWPVDIRGSNLMCWRCYHTVRLQLCAIVANWPFEGQITQYVFWTKKLHNTFTTTEMSLQLNNWWTKLPWTQSANQKRLKFWFGYCITPTGSVPYILL